MAIASFILGIASIAFSAFISRALGIIIGIVGIILARIALRDGTDENIKFAQPGFILSIIGAGLGLIFIIACVGCASCLAVGASSLGSF